MPAIGIIFMALLVLAGLGGAVLASLAGPGEI